MISKKNNMGKIGILAMMVVMGLFLSTGCSSDVDPRPKVVSTIGMIHDVVINIGGDKVNSVSLMGPGVDPHLYKASAGDVKLLSEANLILYNGLHLEAKMIEIFEKMASNTQTMAVTKSIPKDKLLSSADYEGFHDPHVWFDVSLWIYAAKEITKGLIAIDPDNQSFYKANETAYIKKLQDLDIWVSKQIQSISEEKRLLVTAHDAFGYFGKAYQCKVVGLQGISTASEAGTRDIQNVTNIIIEHNIPTIFIESSVPIRHIKALQAAVRAKKRDVQIGHELFTDAMGDPNTMEGTYIGMIKHNVNSIRQGLK